MTTKEIFPHPLSVHSYLLRIRGSVGLYMESGVLDLLNIAPLNEDTYKPAVLDYDNTLDAYWTGEKALMGEIKVSQGSVTYDPPRDEGDSESSVGCDPDDLVNTITMINYLAAFFTTTQEDKETVSYATPTFCPDQLETFYRKRAQNFFPSSAWNAKMRMYIQAIYGSKRDDYKILPGFETLTGLIIGSLSLNPYFGNGYILYTTAQYKYIMLTISGGTISARELELSNAGDRLRTWLINHPQTETETRRYEAYMLSTATIGDGYTVGSVSTEGGTFGYSWKANWGGTEAHIATHAIKDGTENVWEFWHYKLSIDLDESDADTADGFWQDSDNWSFGLTEVEFEEATFRANEDLVWIPNYIGGAMDVFLTQPDAFSGPSHVDSDVPMYVVYNYDDDAFDMVRFFRDTRGSGDGVFGDSEYDSYSTSTPGSVGDSCDAQRCGIDSSSTGEVIEVGFSVEKLGGTEYADYAAIGLDTDNASVSALEVSLDGGPGAEFTGAVSALCEPGPGPNFDTFEVLHSTSGSLASLHGTFRFEDVLMIPFYDCDAVYLASRNVFDGSISTSRALSGTQTQASRNIYYDDSLSWDEELRGTFWGNIRVGFSWSGSGDWSYHVESQAEKQGTLREASGEVIMSHLQVYHFFNGIFNEAHIDKKINDSGVANATYFPSCLSEQLGGLDGEDWEEGVVAFGGYSTHFDPVLFPVSDQAPSVIAKSNLTGDFRATSDPTTGAKISQGSFNYDNKSTFISFVGHD